MKQRFNALDLRVALFELRQAFSGCRVTNIYDVDHKTYLIKLAKPESKAVILIESGIRIHSTEFEVPKNLIPSGFSMKLRKHLRSRRLEKVHQVGADRIVDLQFGSNEAAYHLIVELYDRGNILLTDFEYTIISVLRPRTDENSDVKFTVREKYPLHLARQDESITLEKLNEIFSNAKSNDDVKRLLTTHLTFGASLIEHCMALAQLPDKCIIGKTFDTTKDLNNLYSALVEGEKIMHLISNQSCTGYIVQKLTKSPKLENGSVGEEDILIYDEFQPYLWKKYETLSHIKFDTFDRAVDEFFSKLETQKIEIKESQQNREAVKKLENVKKDHQKRLEELKKSQTEDELKAKLIEFNLELVDHAIYLVNSAIANQLSWNEINEIIEEAKEDNHAVAKSIKQLKLDINHIVLSLKDPYAGDDDDDDDDEENKEYSVEIDLSLTAFKNSRKYYEIKKNLFLKEQKTIQASDKALKSAEKHTLDILKQANKIKTITKARKPFWFEKFYWFISSENYLVIGGRDQQQNEIVVKKYLKAGDIYVHADLSGASSVVIKNPSGKEVPPKTLNEAGCMAVCYSVAWEAKVLANAWWVYHHQVSKQAPTGEYIGTGSFMIRGKKNYLISSALVFGFGLMYKLDEASVERHKNDRRVKTAEEEQLNEEKYSNVEFEEAPQVEDLEEVTEEEKGEIKTGEEVVEDNSDVNKTEEIEANKEEESSNEEEDEEEAAFPDTQFELKPVAKLEENVSNLAIQEDEAQSNEKVSKKEKQKNKPPQQLQQAKKEDASEKKANQNGQLKRGQKSKLNKIKNKYKDQDEEDKEIFMKYLAPAGDNSKNSKNNKKNPPQPQQLPKQQQQQQQQKKQQKPLVVHKQPNEQPEGELAASNDPDQAADQDQDEETQGQNLEDELAILNSLTGVPVEEDEILFCVSVCAPYNCIQNYKHKVKLNPGTTKRGQAVKTAIEIFLRDKQTTPREKDLIKSNLLKDQDTSRNLPGKVKVSAPNLLKLKKK